MRLVIVGKSGFLAGHILAAAKDAGVETQALGHDDPGLATAITSADWVVNGAIHPRLRDRPYQVEHDFDRQVAALAGRAGAGFTMLSSRRVYAPAVCWNAGEDAPADGDGTRYGDNKARGEAAVRASGARWAILRLANVIGPEQGRATFAGRLLTSLKTQGEIHFDMSAKTRRDFLPVEAAAATIVNQARSGAEGVFNLGCGFAAPCGDIAGWIMEGFGGGRLVVSDDTVRDEFFLNMDKTGARFGTACGLEDLRDYCRTLGQTLRDS